MSDLYTYTGVVAQRGDQIRLESAEHLDAFHEKRWIKQQVHGLEINSS